MGRKGHCWGRTEPHLSTQWEPTNAILNWKKGSEKLERIWAGYLEIRRKGHLGGSVGKCLPSAQGILLGSWDRAPRWAPVPRGACFSLCMQLPMVLQFFLQINKILKKKKKNEFNFLSFSFLSIRWAQKYPFWKINVRVWKNIYKEVSNKNLW